MLEEKIQGKGKRKRIRRLKEAKRRGMGSETAGKEMGKHLDLGKGDE